MTAGAQTILFSVSDLDQAKKFYSTLLGTDPAQDSPYYVGFEVADQQIGLVPSGHGGGATPYWHVDDIEARFAALIATGAEEVEAIHDVGGGRRVASVKDADGNTVGLLQDPA
jgi:predicted enzyme related to lactoylglutathione lyase